MAEKTSEHQVIIVGGGITGLTLALCLQRLNVDYVLLEGYGSLTPNAGASILLFPHGLQILDQLGILDELRRTSLPQGPLDYRDGETGKSLRVTSAGAVIESRHGYEPLWSSRYRVCSVLYAAIADKTRLLVNKRVVRIESRPEGALVHTEDGSVYRGQMIAGCDGVRSTVRKEMRRLAELDDPQCVPAEDKDEIGCEYGCVFATTKGSAAALDAVKPGSGALISFQDRQIVLGRGPENDIYVFCTWTLPPWQQKCALDEIPHFSKEDRERVLEGFHDVVFGENGVKIRELFANPVSTGITALPHFTLRKWSHDRIITIGDAAHKFNPVNGLGGNACITSCASLVNSLQRQLGPDLGGKPSWSLTSLTEAFRNTEQANVEKLTTQMNDSQTTIRLLAWRRWVDKLVWRYLVPYVPVWLLLMPYSAAILTGIRLRGPFENPYVKHNWLYNEEKA